MANAKKIDYEALAIDIREKRQYEEAEDGTIYCVLRGCRGSAGLRCQRTSVPICTNCAIKTPVGYISKEAQRAQEDTFYDAETSDYIKTGMAAFFGNLFVGFFATLLGSFVVGFLGFFFGIIILFFISTSAAAMISEIVWRVLQKKRGRSTGRVAMVGIIFSTFLFFLFMNPIVVVFYGVVVASTINARFQLGIRL